MVGLVATHILGFLIRVVLAPLNGILVAFATAGELHNLTTEPWAQTLIAGSQALAGAILAVRTAWEAFQLATARSEGALSDPGLLLQRVVLTAVAIAAGPWLAVQAMVAGNLLAQAVAHAGLGTGLGGLGSVAGNIAELSGGMAATVVWEPLLLLCGVVLIILCFIQSIVRTIEMTLAAIVAPVMALGFLSGGGTANVWFQEVVILASTQAVQLLLLYMAAALLVAPSAVGSVVLGPYLFLGACWVAWRSPQVLRRYAYHTGARDGVQATVARASARLLTKLPF